MSIFTPTPTTQNTIRDMKFKRTLTVAFASCLLLSASVLPSEATTPLERSVETINVSLGTDGSIHDIRSTLTHFSLAPQVNSTTTEQQHSPADDAHQLPVRITTSYTTAEKSGNDLNDLNNAHGRIRIDLHVHNLTTTPQDVTLDANGRSYTRRELVGTPLTVVASTTIPGNPAQVVTHDIPLLGATTNGVISQNAAGDTVVQWATVLAPPTMHASERFSLVLDTSNFTPPSFDISVQPGFITDVSGEALIDNALNPEKTPEGQLTADTIRVLADARDVFAESGKTLTEVRELLKNSADNIGTRTIQDLQTSNSRIQTSARGLSGTLTALQSQITHELNHSSNSLTLALQETTNNIHNLLGDTNQKPTQYIPTVDPTTCEVTITATDGHTPSGIFGVLLNLDATMDAYAQASGACHENVVQSLITELGPETPNNELCAAQPETMTCKLHAATRTINDTLEELKKTTTGTSNALLNLPVTDLNGQVTRATTTLNNLRELHKKFATHSALSALNEPRDMLGNETQTIANTITELTTANDELTTLLEQLKNKHNQIRTQAQNGRESINHAQKQLKEAIKLLCADNAAHNNTEEIIELLSSNGCNTQPQNTNTEALDQHLTNADQHFSTIIDNLPNELDEQRALLLPTLDKIKASQLQLTTHIETLNKTTNTAISSRENEFTELGLLLENAHAEITALTPYVEHIDQEISTTVTQVQTDVANSVDTTQSLVNSTINDASTQARNTSQKLGDDSSERIKTILDTVAKSSNVIRDEGKTALETAQHANATNNAALSAQLHEKLTTNALTVTQQVNAAVKNSDAAAVLLSQDISRVLADIGQQKEHGTGLLGAMATSTAQLNLADEQMAQAATNTAQFTGTQRANYTETLLHSAQLRSSLTRLEQAHTFAATQHPTNKIASVYNFRISGK